MTNLLANLSAMRKDTTAVASTLMELPKAARVEPVEESEQEKELPKEKKKAKAKAAAAAKQKKPAGVAVSIDDLVNSAFVTFKTGCALPHHCTSPRVAVPVRADRRHQPPEMPCRILLGRVQDSRAAEEERDEPAQVRGRRRGEREPLTQFTSRSCCVLCIECRDCPPRPR